MTAWQAVGRTRGLVCSCSIRVAAGMRMSLVYAPWFLYNLESLYQISVSLRVQKQHGVQAQEDQ